MYGFLLKLPLFLFPKAPQLQPLDGVLYKHFLMLLLPVGNTSLVIYGFITFVLLYSQALAFNKAVNAQRLHQKPNYLTGMSYLLITSLFSEWFSLSAPLIINSILIWVWSRLCTIHSPNNAKTTIFNIGFAIGIASFLYFPAVVFIILLMAGLTVTRSFNLREWLLGLVGILTPFYFFISWLFLSGKLKEYHLPGLAVTLPAFKESRWAYAAIILVISAVVIGSIFIQNNLRRQIVQTRKSWQLMFLYLIVALFIPFLNDTHSFNYWILIAVPISLITASAFLYPEKRWFPLSMHWAMVAISIAIGYFVK